MGLPRYLASAGVTDPEHTVWLAEQLVEPREKAGSVCLLQCGRPSLLAAELSRHLRKHGRRTVPLVVKDRDEAQADSTLTRLVGTSCIWVFADDLLQSFLTVFATQLAFSLRAKAKSGLPVVGIGNGALALGGLLLANRICRNAQYDLVSGLGWAPRLLADSGADRAEGDAAVARATVRSLPGLLGVDLRSGGGIRVDGARVESIGSEPILLIGAGENGSILSMPLDPGRQTVIAPPPFAPFERGLLPPATLKALSAELRPRPGDAAVAQPALRQAPPPSELTHQPEDGKHAEPGSGRMCPMCRKVHAAEPHLSLAA